MEANSRSHFSPGKSLLDKKLLGEEIFNECAVNTSGTGCSDQTSLKEERSLEEPTLTSDRKSMEGYNSNNTRKQHVGSLMTSRN